MENTKKAAHAALMAVQRGLPKLGKDTKGHGYDYLDLPTLMGAALPLLHDNGFVLRFVPGRDSEGRHEETAVLAHETGEAYQATMAAEPLKPWGRANAVQALGATSTYLRRYALQAVLGICAEVDVDASTASADSELSQKFTNQFWAAKKAKASKEELTKIHGAAKAAGLRWDSNAHRYEVVS